MIIAGGDGTINAVVNQLQDFQLPIGIVPIGSVNILALEFNIPFDVRLACQRIIQATAVSFDLAAVNGRYFTCMCGIGIDAQVIKHTPSSLKKKIGLLSFAIVLIRQLMTSSLSLFIFI